jgi:hypothetical protein
MSEANKSSEPGRPTVTAESTTQKLQAQLADKLMGAFDFVLTGRSKYYSENPDKVPPTSAIPTIVNDYATKNMALSAGISLIPGPWGMAAAIPEVALLIRNQLAMIYDIGAAHGKSKVLNKELLAGVFLTAMGVGAGGLLVMQGGKVLVRRVALRVFQRVVMLLAGKVTQQLLKSIVSKWVPIIGAAAMGAWANYSTRQIGRKAAEILAKPIEIIDDASGDETSIDGNTMAQAPATSVKLPNYAILKIRALIGLMKIDRKLKPEENTYIQSLIENIDIPDEAKMELANLMDNETRLALDFAAFANEPDEVVGMLIDLISLAKRDGEFHLAEKLYIKQAGRQMGLSEQDVIDAMTMEPPVASAYS